MTQATFVQPRATQNALLALVWGAAFVAGSFLFVALVPAWDNSTLSIRGDLATPALFIGAAILCAAVAVVAGMKARAAGRVEVLRQRAARGEAPRSLLAADQPEPLVDAEAPPVMIVMRPRRWVRIGIGLWVAYCVVLAVALPIFDLSGGDYLRAVTDAGMCAMFAWLARGFMGRQRIEASERGLAREVLGFTVVKPWSDARLFAIVHRDRHGRPDAFELATWSGIMWWRWLRPDGRFWWLFDPDLPWHEYDQQMRTLHSMIAARTGLPLYDLSGGGRMGREVRRAHASG